MPSEFFENKNTRPPESEEEFYSEEDTGYEEEYAEDFAETSAIFYSWDAQEYEKTPRTRNWYMLVISLFCLLLIYALFSNNLLMAVVFILFAVVLYLFEKKEPRTYQFSIRPEGVLVKDTLYEFSSLASFWIFYEPDGKKILSLKSQKKYLPYIHLPLGTATPVELREILLEFLPEEKQDEGILDALERFI